jgi:hypothetical protein
MLDKMYKQAKSDNVAAYMAMVSFCHNKFWKIYILELLKVPPNQSQNQLTLETSNMLQYSGAPKLIIQSGQLC